MGIKSYVNCETGRVEDILRRSLADGVSGLQKLPSGKTLITLPVGHITTIK